MSPRIHVATVARALSMLASTAKKATWCVRSFCLVKSSYENSIVDVGTTAARSRDKSFQAFPPLFILQVTKAGCGGLGMRLTAYWGGCICV